MTLRMYTQGIVIDPSLTRWDGAVEFHEQVASLANESTFR